MTCQLTCGAVTVQIVQGGRSTKPKITITCDKAVEVVTTRSTPLPKKPTVKAGDIWYIDYPDDRVVSDSDDVSDDDEGTGPQGRFLVCHLASDDEDDPTVSGVWIYDAADVKTAKASAPAKAHLTNDTYTARVSQLARLCNGTPLQPNVLDVHSAPASVIPFLSAADVIAAATAGRMPADDDVYRCRWRLKGAITSEPNKRKR